MPHTRQTWSKLSTQEYVSFFAHYPQRVLTYYCSQVRTVIYDGDADFIVNFKGVENLLANLNGINFSSTDFSNYTVNGNPAGLVKNMEGTSLSYLRVFGAGHEVPAYNYTGLETGQAALQFFSQAWNGNELTST